MIRTIFLVSFWLAIFGRSAIASEVSLLSVGFQKSKVESSYTKAVISASGRYSMQSADRVYYFAEVGLAMTSFSGELAPSDHAGYTLGWGIRYYFDRLSEVMAPYASGDVALVSQEESTFVSDSLSSKRDDGLRYAGRVGLRWSLSSDFFIDIEAKLFESWFLNDRKVHTVSRVGQTTVKNEHKESRSDLFLKAYGDWRDIRLVVGLRL